MGIVRAPPRVERALNAVVDNLPADTNVRAQVRTIRIQRPRHPSGLGTEYHKLLITQCHILESTWRDLQESNLNREMAHWCRK